MTPKKRADSCPRQKSNRCAGDEGAEEVHGQAEDAVDRTFHLVHERPQIWIFQGEAAGLASTGQAHVASRNTIIMVSTSHERVSDIKLRGDDGYFRATDGSSVAVTALSLSRRQPHRDTDCSEKCVSLHKRSHVHA